MLAVPADMVKNKEKILSVFSVVINEPFPE
jgi:hypothetical protein